MKEEKKTIWSALAAFQQEVPTIHKGTKGYGYSYADLPTIFEVINPLLKKHSLGFTQLIEAQSIKTILFHTQSDGRIESVTDIPQDVSLKGMNQYQVLGSAITYIRRYALSSMLGLVTDKDTDAGGEQTNTPKKALPKLDYDKAVKAIEDGKTTVADILKVRTVTDAEKTALEEVEEYVKTKNK